MAFGQFSTLHLGSLTFLEQIGLTSFLHFIPRLDWVDLRKVVCPLDGDLTASTRASELHWLVAALWTPPARSSPFFFFDTVHLQHCSSTLAQLARITEESRRGSRPGHADHISDGV